MQTHGGLAAPKAVCTGCHKNYKSREIKNICHFQKSCRMEVESRVCDPDPTPWRLTNSGRTWFDTHCKRCDDPFLWTDTDVFHWYWCSVIRNVWSFGLPTDWSWMSFIEDKLLCSTTVMVSRRVEFTIIRLCVIHFGMLVQSFPSPRNVQ